MNVGTEVLLICRATFFWCQNNMLLIALQQNQCHMLCLHFPSQSPAGSVSVMVFTALHALCN